MRNILQVSGILLLGIVMGGCAELTGTQNRSDHLNPAVVFRSTSAGTILSCINEADALSKSEFKQLYEEASQLTEQGEDNITLRLICLGMHPRASYEQFKESISLLAAYSESHPDDREELQGLSMLLDELNQAKITKWAEYDNMVAEQKNLEDEVTRLKTEMDTAREDDQARIQELQEQIEQLKNIEKIIKNREQTNIGS